ncbi:uncharacterized protein LOC106651076 [Trichogramma pretiosum]|uniref:uncharacterized protein LOC106651076 n=1 Tax=Trichogramma pretiosum TaxID=7493 RepID=UPI0006C9DBC4|nr:uncharacterized protein LOC106651076 [Trichogramma pretiosum]
MWSSEAGLLCCLCLATLLLTPSTLGDGAVRQTYGQSCELEVFPSNCGENERCHKTNQTDGVFRCDCELEYEFDGKKCVERPRVVPPTPNSSPVKPEADQRRAGGGSVTALLLVPTVLVLLSAALYIGARRYKWLQRFRQFRQNRYGSVLVTRDDTDDDDPPIA